MSEKSSSQWTWPVEFENYDRNPELNVEEKEILNANQSCLAEGIAPSIVVEKCGFAKLRTLASSGELLAPIPDLIRSYMHMHINRMMRASAREHELVIYDFLFRVHDSHAARSRNGGQMAQRACT